MLSAQTIERSVIGSAGGVGSFAGGEVSFTVGEAVTATVSAGSFLLTQGFQQPSANTNVSSEKLIEVSWQAYPNPTKDQVEIKLTSDRKAVLQASVFDLAGRNTGIATQQAQLPGQVILRFDLSAQPNGVYLVRLMDEAGKEAQAIRVQKID